MLSIYEELCIAEAPEGVQVDVDTNVETGSQEVVDNSGVDNTPQTYEIDGEQYTLDQIKSFRQGYDSYTKVQNDYQALQQQSSEALELFNYLKSNQELSKKLYEYDQELQGGLQNKLPSQEKEMFQNMQREINVMKIEKQLASIEAKDPNVDKVQLLTLANQNNISLDLAYNVLRGMNFENELKKSLENQSKDMTNQIQNNAKITKTLITEGDNKSGGQDLNFGLSTQEVTMAEKLGMSLEEYAKWK